MALLTTRHVCAMGAFLAACAQDEFVSFDGTLTTVYEDISGHPPRARPRVEPSPTPRCLRCAPLAEGRRAGRVLRELEWAVRRSSWRGTPLWERRWSRGEVDRPMWRLAWSRTEPGFAPAPVVGAPGRVASLRQRLARGFRSGASPTWCSLPRCAQRLMAPPLLSLSLSLSSQRRDGPAAPPWPRSRRPGPPQDEDFDTKLERAEVPLERPVPDQEYKRRRPVSLRVPPPVWCL